MADQKQCDGCGGLFTDLYYLYSETDEETQLCETCAEDYIEKRDQEDFKNRRDKESDSIPPSGADEDR